jgi:tRNA1(Val) A37 N6-methylase TrmN6
VTPDQHPIACETREDRFLNGRVRLLQPARGYRAGLDAALLAASVELAPGERALEAGCGAGAALFQLAAREPEAHLAGIERDEAMLALARKNAILNGAAERVELRAGDVAAGFRALGLAPFDAAFANPPFFDDAGALRAPSPERRGAWIADDGLSPWLGFLLKAVREGGRITVIHRADRLGDLLTGLAPKAGSFRIRPVQPFADAPAKRVLVRAVKTGKAPLVLLPPLVLHERQGDAKHRPEVEAILRGEAALGWISRCRAAARRDRASGR